MDLSVVIPVFNAAGFVAGRLAVLSEQLSHLPFSFEVLPVDDGSTDGTAAVLEGLDLPGCRPILGGPHRGKYAALRHGVAKTHGKVVIMTDADLPYEGRAIPYMVRLLRHEGFHLVVGDRTLPGSSYSEHLPLLRQAATRAFTLFIRLLVTGGLHDTQCGLKGFRGDVARLLFPLLQEKGFAGDVELLYVALKHNLAIRRIPVRIQFQGPSTVRPWRHGLAMVRNLMRLRRRYRRGVYSSAELESLARQDYWNWSDPLVRSSGEAAG